MTNPTKTAIWPLDRARAVDILLAVDEHPLNVTGLQEEVGGSHGTTQARLEELLDADLIDIHRDGEGKTAPRYAVITEKGETVATILRSLREVLTNG